MIKRSTDPARVEIGITEEKPYEIDFAARLGAGEGIDSVVGVTVMHLESKTMIPEAIPNAPTLSGTNVTATVIGSALEPRAEYLMIATVAMSGRRESTETILDVDY